MATKSLAREITKNDDDNVCGLLFKQIDRPLGYLMCRAINVYDDRYRINVYVKTDVEGIEGKRIANSYFCKLDEHNNLTILS